MKTPATTTRAKKREKTHVGDINEAPPGTWDTKGATPASDMAALARQLQDEGRAEKIALEETKAPETAPVEIPQPKLPAGVHLSIAIASSIGACSSTGVMLLRNNPVALEGAEAAVEQDKPGLLMVANSEYTAISRCCIHERQATTEKNLITRVPAALAKIGKTTQTIKFASGGDETLFGRSRVWVADSKDSQTATVYNPLQEVPAMPPAAFRELSGDELIIEIPLNVLLKVSEAVNGVSNQDGAKVRIAIDDVLEEVTQVAILGSDGIGLIPCTVPEQADVVEHIKKFNQTVIDARMMFEQLPESLRKLEKSQEEEDGSLSKAYIAPGQEITKAQREPWQAEYELTPVMSLDLPDTLKKLLVGKAMETIGHLQAVAQAHPNTHFTEIEGVGAGKAEKIGEAMRKVWSALKKKHETPAEQPLSRRKQNPPRPVDNKPGALATGTHRSLRKGCGALPRRGS